MEDLYKKYNYKLLSEVLILFIFYMELYYSPLEGIVSSLFLLHARRHYWSGKLQLTTICYFFGFFTLLKHFIRYTSAKVHKMLTNPILTWSKCVGTWKFGETAIELSTLTLKRGKISLIVHLFICIECAPQKLDRFK